MATTTVLLAEIGDKMGTALGTFLLSAGIALVIHLFSRLHWSLGLLVFPVAAFGNWITLQELREPIGTAILNELGWRWVGWQLVAFNTPLAVVGVWSLHLRRSRIWASRANQGRCLECGYDLRGLPVGCCPECGCSSKPAAA
ncbi:MAG: hypothetical protein KF768_09635 [Phycisphaeraceae bacterium]|nr:hypothetical protein [Phycisphaeraceae bacterium]